MTPLGSPYILYVKNKPVIELRKNTILGFYSYSRTKFVGRSAYTSSVACTDGHTKWKQKTVLKITALKRAIFRHVQQFSREEALLPFQIHLQWERGSRAGQTWPCPCPNSPQQIIAKRAERIEQIKDSWKIKRPRITKSEETYGACVTKSR